MRFRSTFFLALLGVASLIAVGCGNDDDGGSAPEQPAAESSATEAPEPEAPEAEPAADVLVAFMSNQAAGDQGPVDGMIAGLEASSAANGHDIQVVEALDPAGFETQLRNLADSGAEIIITTFFDLGATVELIAPDYPDVKFITVVSSPTEQPNVNA
ncbi:MAG: hypothetical protein OXF64_01575, partial [bacterium]|nr:hypothetical protein [bacterium]